MQAARRDERDEPPHQLRSREQQREYGDRQFYEDDRGTNYAQARYVCYWLQERELLTRLVRGMQARGEDDPTGYRLFVGLVGPDIAKFEKQWASDTLALVNN